VEKTKVDEKTTNAFYIIQGNEATDNELLLATARKILDETIKYCGGKGRIIIPIVR
jgi:DNA/RNA-binding domain of Phe-tRNA-synthetase-like protein